MTEVIKGKALRQDLALYDGINTTRQRKSSAGGYVQGNAVGDEVDVLMVHGQGLNRTQTTIQNCVNSLGSLNRSIKFSPGTWTIESNTTIPANLTSLFPAGVVFNISTGITLTVSGPYKADSQNLKTGSGTLTFTDEKMLQSVSGTNTITATVLSTLTTLANGQEFSMVPATTNTGAATLNINGTGAVNLRKNQSGGVVALVANDLIANNLYRLVYNSAGPYFMVNCLSAYAQGADIASATTINLDTATGDYVHVTGTTAITGITLKQGQERTLVFDGALTFTHGASLLLGGSNITTVAGDIAVVRGEASGVVRLVAYRSVEVFMPKGYISGFVPTAAADTDHDLTFTVGECKNASNTISCRPTWTTLTKQIDAIFAEGTNQGGMATGSVANSTAYYYNLIRKNSDTTVFDICIDVSSSNANTPSGWTFMREIHREFTDGSANIRVQTYQEVAGGGIRSKLGTVLTGFTDSDPGADLVTKTLPVPPSVEVRGTLVLIDATVAAATYIVFTEVGSTATEPDVNNYTLFVGGITTEEYTFTELQRFTNASRNVEYELSASTADHSVWFQIFSWVNHRRA